MVQAVPATDSCMLVFNKQQEPGMYGAKDSFYAISQDGMKNYHTRKIENTGDVLAIIEEKKARPHWNLSTNDRGVLDLNPATPLYIYGAQTAQVIIDGNENILYSTWGGEHADHWNAVYLENFKPE